MNHGWLFKLNPLGLAIADPYIDSNLQILSDKIGMKMLLENKSNIRTTILLGEYFSE